MTCDLREVPYSLSSLNTHGDTHISQEWPDMAQGGGATRVLAGGRHFAAEEWGLWGGGFSLEGLALVTAE